MEVKKSDGFTRAYSEGVEHLAPRIAHRALPAPQLEPLFEPDTGTFVSGNVSYFAQLRRKRSGNLLRQSSEEEEAEKARQGSKGSSDRLEAPKLSMSIFLGSRCTRVHFVRHAEGHHNVVTREAGRLAEAMLHKAQEAAYRGAIESGKSASEAEALAKTARMALERIEENRPVHYATAGAHRYTDAELTEAGRNQCYALRGKMARNLLVDPLLRTHIDLVVVSPLRRCLETADIIFGPSRSEGRPELDQFLVNDLCRERYGEFYCDKRLPMSETREDPRWSDWDWDSQKINWPTAVGEFTDEDTVWAEEREPDSHVHDRAMQFLQWLAKRPEREVAVVTHSSFLKNLFKVFGGNTSQDDQDVLRALPANCELRTVVLCHHG